MDRESRTNKISPEELSSARSKMQLKKNKENGTQQPVTKDRKTAGVEERARDHPVGMTGATERKEKRRER